MHFSCPTVHVIHSAHLTFLVLVGVTVLEKEYKLRTVIQMAYLRVVPLCSLVEVYKRLSAVSSSPSRQLRIFKLATVRTSNLNIDCTSS